jgi:hypothetical protein
MKNRDSCSWDTKVTGGSKEGPRNSVTQITVFFGPKSNRECLVRLKQRIKQRPRFPSALLKMKQTVQEMWESYSHRISSIWIVCRRGFTNCDSENTCKSSIKIVFKMCLLSI